MTASKMHQLGITTGADLLQWSEQALVERFGKAGHYYYGIARGRDERQVNPHRIRKSIGAERSFHSDLSGMSRLTEELESIAHMVHQRLVENQRAGYTLTLKIKYANYQQITRSQTIPNALQGSDEIYALGKELLINHVNSQQSVRLLGLTISNLLDTQKSPKQLSFQFSGV